MIDFVIASSTESLTVYTTRPDTIFGVTALLVSPEHPQVLDITTDEHLPHVQAYQEEASKKSTLDRKIAQVKSGVFSGAYAVHPITGDELPVWVADYVLSDYATGSIMVVPAHDERDHEFCKKYDIAIKPVIDEEGNLIDSDVYSGLPWAAAKEKITADLEAQ